MGNQVTQFFPPPPTFTEDSVPDLSAKVYIVTGASSGIARSESKASAAITRIKARVPDSKGQLIYLHLDLADLSTIKSSADTFLNENDRLDILFNNAGVMLGPQSAGSKTAQGYEVQLGTICIGPFLFSKLLRPILAQKAKTAPADSVRVVWVSSNSAENNSPINGIDMSNLNYHINKSGSMKYGISKEGNIFHSSEFARRTKGEGIISVALHPGALKSDLNRHTPAWLLFLAGWILKEPIYGAYTEIFAGVSPEIDASRSGCYVIPWGRFYVGLRKDWVAAQMEEEEGGTGVAGMFWEWCEEQVKDYA